MTTSQRPTTAHPLASALTSVVDRLGLEPRLQRELVLRHWDCTVGPQIARHARPWRLHGGELWVIVNHPGWAQHLAFLKASIVRELNRAVGEPIVRDLRFVAGRLPGRRGTPGKASRRHRPVNGAAEAPPTGAGSSDAGVLTTLDARLSAVADGDVREAAGRWLRAAWLRRQQAMQRGWPLCTRCRCPFQPPPRFGDRSERALCGACRAVEENRLRHRIRALLIQEPWLQCGDVTRLEGPRAARLFREERAALLAEWRGLLLSYARRTKGAEAPPPEARMLLIAYALLRTGLRPDQLESGIVCKAAGPRLRGLCDYFFGGRGTASE